MKTESIVSEEDKILLRGLIHSRIRELTEFLTTAVPVDTRTWSLEWDRKVANAYQTLRTLGGLIERMGL